MNINVSTTPTMLELNLNPSEKHLRQFAALVLPLAAALVSALLWLRFNRPTAALILLAIIAVTSIAGYFRPALLRPIYITWMLAAYPIGWLISHLVIAMIFFLVVTPTGLVMRLVGRDPLNCRFEPSRESYWQPREQTDSSRHFRQF